MVREPFAILHTWMVSMKVNTVYPESLQLGNITRPSHIHVIVGVPGQPLITTQVYFEDEPNDAYLKDSLIVKPVTDANGTKIAHFDFLVEDYSGFDISKGLQAIPQSILYHHRATIKPTINK